MRMGEGHGAGALRGHPCEDTTSPSGPGSSPVNSESKPSVFHFSLNPIRRATSSVISISKPDRRLPWK